MRRIPRANTAIPKVERRLTDGLKITSHTVNCYLTWCFVAEPVAKIVDELRQVIPNWDIEGCHCVCVYIADRPMLFGNSHTQPTARLRAMCSPTVPILCRTVAATPSLSLCDVLWNSCPVMKPVENKCNEDALAPTEK
jgi:hypothetical protein